ncbi:MAG: hypothetical protein ABDH28_00365 [Brevinematia bacterium]
MAFCLAGVTLYEVSNNSLVSSTNRLLAVVSLALFSVTLFWKDYLLLLALGLALSAFLLYIILTSIMVRVTLESVVNILSFLASAVILGAYIFGYSGKILVLIEILLLSTYVLVMVFLNFRRTYLLLVYSKEEVQDKLSQISSILRSVSLLLNKVELYESSHRDLVLSLDGDVRKVYNYFRYVGNIISSLQNRLSEVRFEFERYIQDLSTLVKKLDLLIGRVVESKVILSSFDETLGRALLKIRERIELFRSFSEKVGVSLTSLKEVKQNFQKVIALLGGFSDDLLLVRGGIALIEQLGVEGEISSRGYNLTSLSGAFRAIKGRSSREIEEINKVRSSISETVFKNISILDKLSGLEKELYSFLSLSDSIVNISMNILMELEKTKVSLSLEDKVLGLSESKARMSEVFSKAESVKGDFLGYFSSLDKVLDVLGSVGVQIVDLVSAVGSITNATELMLKRLGSVRLTLGEIREDIDSTLV